MPLSLTTRRKQQTLCAKWSTQQHLVQHNGTDVAATNANLFRHHQHHANYLSQPLWKQKSLAENLQLNKKTILTSHTGRGYLSRGLSMGRSLDQHVVRKHSVGKNERDQFKRGDLMKKNINNFEKSDGVGGGGSANIFRSSRRVQAWSSTSSILKTLDKELAHLNGVTGKRKDVKVAKEPAHTADNVKVNKPKADSQTTSEVHNSHSNRKQVKSEVSKVNLNIILSHSVDTAKEENAGVLTDRDVEGEDTDELTSSNGNASSSCAKTNNSKKSDNSATSLKPPSNTRPVLSAQKRRSLYRNSKLAANLALSNNTGTSNSFIQNSQNCNTCPSLNTEKRAPLVRAMSAPVRTFDETTKSSATFMNAKRKSRRRKLNSRNASCDKGSAYNLVTANDFSADAKTALNRKFLPRSKSVVADVVTLVSLISSEGSDSEKEDSSLTPNSSHNDSSNTRAPCLRKSGKSVSFQENYPPAFQFASKEYSHMLRRGSIASLAQRIKSNRPPTAPAGFIYRNAQKLYNEMTTNPNTEATEATPCNLEDIKNNESKTSPVAMSVKPLEEEYQFPDYVRSLKERECWKLFMKMSAKGVNITYDTILRGMLTPTEFRQLQKQRDIEEAKALKAANISAAAESSKKAPTPIERLKESLLKN